MKSFTIIGILAAARCFSRQESANVNLEKALRETEGKRQNKMPEEVVIIEEQSLYDVFSMIVPSHCLDKMVVAVVNKYTALGHELVP